MSHHKITIIGYNVYKAPHMLDVRNGESLVYIYAIYSDIFLQSLVDFINMSIFVDSSDVHIDLSYVNVHLMSQKIPELRSRHFHINSV